MLVSPLNPEAPDFEFVLRNVPGSGLLLRAVEDGRLLVMNFQRDFAVNLCRQGPSGFIRELDAVRLNLETVIVVDQADDLFTPRDPAACLQQAATYRHWALPRGHTFVMAFLNVTQANPLLGGNQAALSYFTGLADASMGTHGLVLQAEFWEDKNQVDAEGLAAVGAWPEMSLRGVNGLHASSSQHAEDPRLPAWYVGSADTALLDQADLINWEVVDSLLPLFAADAPARHAVLVVDRSTNFDDFVLQTQDLRSRMSPSHSIIVRESGYSLREFPQRAMLKAAGADAILSKEEPLGNMIGLLRDFNSKAVSGAAGGTLETENLQTLKLIQRARGGRLPLSQFAAEIEEVLAQSLHLQIPCTLAEIPCPQEAGAGVLLFPEVTSRSGDLSTSAAGAQLYFLRGCRQHDAVKVIERLLWQGETVKSSNRLNLFSGPTAVRTRLQELTRDEPPKSSSNHEKLNLHAKAKSTSYANTSDATAPELTTAQAPAPSRRRA